MLLLFCATGKERRSAFRSKEETNKVQEYTKNDKYGKLEIFEYGNSKCVRHA